MTNRPHPQSLAARVNAARLDLDAAVEECSRFNDESGTAAHTMACEEAHRKYHRLMDEEARSRKG